MLTHRTGLWWGVAFACVGALVHSAHAQVPLSSIEPGQIEQQLKRSPLPVPDAEYTLPAAPEKIPDIQEGGPEFVLNEVRVEGATAFSTDSLAAFYRDQIGKTIRFGDVQRIAAQITEHYRREGYLLSYAIIPPQRVSGGSVTIRVIEGYLDSVQFKGVESAGLLDQLKAYGAHVTSERPLKAATLERYLLLMDDIAGAKVSGLLSPSPDTLEAAMLMVDVSQDPWEGEATANNRGSRYLGPLQIGARIAANGQLLGAEQVQFRSVVSGNLDELRYYEGSYQQPIGGDGLVGRVTLTRTETAPGNALEILDIEGKSHSLSAGVNYPFLRTRRENWYGLAGFDIRNTRSKILDTEIYEDHIRTLNVGTSYSSYDALGGVHSLNGNLVQGIGILDASHTGDALSRANAHPNATRMEAGYSYQYPLPHSFSLSFNASGQYALDPLVASEEFSLGGELIGSAYDPAEIAGDSGIGARLELRYQDILTSDFLPFYQIYAFYDGGKVWNRGALPSENAHESLTSAGIGSRMALPYGLSGNLEIAKPLTHRVAAEGSDGKATRFFFGLIAPF